MSAADPLAARELATFVAAVETGSVQGAADALALTQSAATKRIQSLERRLGTALLERGRRGVRPTAAGQMLYPDAKEALLALQRAERNALAGRDARADTLRLAASHTVGGFLLPHWLAVFRADCPGVQAQVEIVNSPGVLALVRGGDAEIGFVEGRDDVSDLESIVVGEDELVAVVRAGHRWSRRRDVRPSELSEEPFYAREAGSGTRAVAEHRLAEVGTVLRPWLQVASTESLKRAIRDDGFTLLSRHAVISELASGELVALPVRGVNLHRALRAVRQAGARREAAAERLWRWLADAPRA